MTTECKTSPYPRSTFQGYILTFAFPQSDKQMMLHLFLDKLTEKNYNFRHVRIII